MTYPARSLRLYTNSSSWLEALLLLQLTEVTNHEFPTNIKNLNMEEALILCLPDGATKATHHYVS